MPVSDEAFRSLMWHPACRSPMSLRSDMLVSDGSQIRHVGLQWISDGYSIIKIFKYLRQLYILLTLYYYLSMISNFILECIFVYLFMSPTENVCKQCAADILYTTNIYFFTLNIISKFIYNLENI